MLILPIGYEGVGKLFGGLHRYAVTLLTQILFINLKC